MGITLEQYQNLYKVGGKMANQIFECEAPSASVLGISFFINITFEGLGGKGRLHI